MIYCKCSACGWNHFALRPFAVPCGKCGTIVQCGAEFNSQSFAEQSAEETREAARSLWCELHRFPFSEAWACQSRCQWWADWQSRIPNINCDCRRHWRELVEKMPPNFSSPAAFFAWSVSAHNVVNARLGKPVMSLEEARCLYDPNALI